MNRNTRESYSQQAIKEDLTQTQVYHPKMRARISEITPQYNSVNAVAP